MADDRPPQQQPPPQPQANNVHNPIQSFSAQPPERINIRDQNDKARIWKDWAQQYEWFELAAGIKQLPAERQVGILMNSLGPDVIGTFTGFQLTDEEKKDPDLIKRNPK